MARLLDEKESRGELSAAGPDPPVPAFVNALPPLIRYRALVYIGRRNRSRGHLETARMAFQRAAQLFPGRKEAHELLDEVRERLGGTVVVRGSSDPLLPLRRGDFDAKPSRPVRGAMTGNLWEIEKRLGEGSMGVVFRVRNLAVNGRDAFALKTYRAVRAWDETVTRRFQKEALTWIRLGRHPNIVQAFWVEKLEGALCIVMEYVPGKSLKEAIKQGPIPPRRALPLALNLCDGLRYARDALGVVHLDVKPENCLIGADGGLKLADFGISTIQRNFVMAGSGSAEHSAGRDFVGGTEVYQAPEQCNPMIELDERADIHAFGITFGEMLAGELLDRDRIAQGVACGRLAGPLWELVRHSVEPDREHRPRNLDELRRGLEACYADLFRTGAPSPPTAPEPTCDEYMDRAAAFVSLGEYALAIESHKLALQTRRDDPALWAGLSAAQLKAGDYSAAIETADRGIVVGRKTSSLLNNKGQALAAAGRPTEALGCFEDALSFDPANPVILCNRAEVLWNLNACEKALGACEAALAADPRSVRALVIKANILLESQHVSEAYEELQNAARIDPHDSDVLFGLSCVLDRLERPSESLGYLESALTVSQGNAAMLRHRGWLLLKLKRAKEAIGYLNEALAQDPCDVEALRAKCLALLADGKRAEAIDVIRTAARVDPSSLLVQQALQLATAPEPCRSNDKGVSP
jgi:serine/threonine protein kinase/thioredoxin-like negative regulator of GroEL